MTNSIVLNHNISFIRNIKGYQFPKTLNIEDRMELNKILLQKINQMFPDDEKTIYNLKNIDGLTKNIMVEQDVIPDDVFEKDAYMVIIGDMLNIELNIYDHIRLSITANDDNLNRDYAQAISYLKELENSFSFSYDLYFGYRTSNILHSGNGFSGYYIVHLPIIQDKDKEWIKKYVQSFGFTIYPYFRHIKKSFYVIQTEINEGNTFEILSRLQQVISYLESYELAEMRKLKDNSLRVEKLLRQIDQFKGSSTITENESISLISKIFLANNLGFINTKSRDCYFEILKNVRKFSILNYKKTHDIQIKDEELRAQIIKNFLEREDRYVQQFG